MKKNGTGRIKRNRQGGIGMRKPIALLLALALALAMLCATAEDSEGILLPDGSIQGTDGELIVEDEVTTVDEGSMNFELADDAKLGEEELVIGELSLESIESNLLADELAEREIIVEDPPQNNVQNGATTSESSAYSKIMVFDQYGGGWANWSLNYGATGGNNMENGGCHIFAYAHAIQWLTGNKLSYENRTSLIEELISVCDIPWGPTGYNSTDAQALYNSHIISKYGAKEKAVPENGTAMEDLFNHGGVVIANPGGHYIIAVGAAYDDLDGNGSKEYYIHIVDSSCQSTWWRTNQNYDSVLYDFSSLGIIQGYGRSGNSFITGTVNGNAVSKWGGGEYWVPYSVFSRYRIDRAYISGKTAPPVVTVARIIDISPTGYTVECEATDDYSIQTLRIGTWNDIIGIDAAQWENKTATNGKASFYVSINNFNNAQNTCYHTNVYAIDGSGIVSDGVRAGDVVLEATPPVVTYARVTNVSPTGYIVECEAKDDSIVQTLRIGTWNDVIGIDAAHWENKTATNGKASFNITISDFNNAQNTTYYTNVYAIDKCGNVSEGIRAGNTYIAAPTPIPTHTPIPTLPTPTHTPAPTSTPTPMPRTSLAKAKITVKDQVYTGKALKPAVRVKYGSKTLKKGTDYTVTYKNNKVIGTAAVTVKGKGDYTGTAKVTFKINPKAVTGLKLAAGKGKLTASWKKPAGGVGGYQLQYALKKSFEGGKKVTVSKSSTIKATLKSLKAGKTYYVRIRTYKKVGKTTYWSAWSAAKQAKVK